jgi:hypothetical protein
MVFCRLATELHWIFREVMNHIGFLTTVCMSLEIGKANNLNALFSSTEIFFLHLCAVIIIFQ